MFNLKKEEWCLIVIVSLFLIAITSIPLIIGKIFTPSDHFFWGAISTNYSDTAVYYSWIEQVKDGHWLFKNLYGGKSQIGRAHV